MKGRYIHWLLEHRLIVIVLSLLAVMLMGSGARNLHFVTDYQVFFSEENPQLKAFNALQDTYSKNDNILFVIAPKNKQVFSRETLAAVEELTKEAWQIPYSNRVDSISNYQHTRAEDDDLIVEDLVTDAEKLTDAQLSAIKNVALNEPLLLDRLISPTAETTGVNVILQLPGKDQHLAVPEASLFAKELVAKFLDFVGLFFASASIAWLFVVFPFDFAHFADVLPESLRFLVQWISNDIARGLMVPAFIAHLGFAVVSAILRVSFYKARAERSSTRVLQN